jgi:hypothetical protein
MPESQLGVMSSINMEQREIERRAQNVMVFGLERAETAEADDARISNLLDVLRIEKGKVLFFKRFRSAEATGAPPVVVRLRSKEDRAAALGAAKTLKESATFARVYIKPDLTVAERFGRNQLRIEMRKANEEEEKKGSSVRYRVAGYRLAPYKVPAPAAPGRPESGGNNINDNQSPPESMDTGNLVQL